MSNARLSTLGVSRFKRGGERCYRRTCVSLVGADRVFGNVFRREPDGRMSTWEHQKSEIQLGYCSLSGQTSGQIVRN